MKILLNSLPGSTRGIVLQYLPSAAKRFVSPSWATLLVEPAAKYGAIYVLHAVFRYHGQTHMLKEAAIASCSNRTDQYLEKYHKVRLSMMDCVASNSPSATRRLLVKRLMTLRKMTLRNSSSSSDEMSLFKEIVNACCGTTRHSSEKILFEAFLAVSSLRDRTGALLRSFICWLLQRTSLRLLETFAVQLPLCSSREGLDLSELTGLSKRLLYVLLSKFPSLSYFNFRGLIELMDDEAYQVLWTRGSIAWDIIFGTFVSGKTYNQLVEAVQHHDRSWSLQPADSEQCYKRKEIAVENVHHRIAEPENVSCDHCAGAVDARQQSFEMQEELDRLSKEQLCGNDTNFSIELEVPHLDASSSSSCSGSGIALPSPAALPDSLGLAASASVVSSLAPKSILKNASTNPAMIQPSFDSKPLPIHQLRGCSLGSCPSTLHLLVLYGFDTEPYFTESDISTYLAVNKEEITKQQRDDVASILFLEMEISNRRLVARDEAVLELLRSCGEEE